MYARILTCQDSLVLPCMPNGSQTVTFPTAVGATNDILLAPDLNITQLSELFSSVVPQTPGSTIVVEETFTIGVTIDQPGLIDVDLRWFGNKYYLGTWRMSESALGFPIDIESEGFISARLFTLRRERPYLLRPQNSENQSFAGEMTLDWCNLQLIESDIQTTVNLPPVPGLVPYSTANAMRGRYGRLDAKLGIGVLKPRIGSLLLWLNTGCSLSSAVYTIEIAPQAEAIELEYIQTGECLIGGNCDSEFQAFLNTEQGYATPSAAIAAYLFFLDPTGGLVDDGSIPTIAQTFPCTNGETRTYYVVDVIIG